MRREYENLLSFLTAAGFEYRFSPEAFSSSSSAASLSFDKNHIIPTSFTADCGTMANSVLSNANAHTLAITTGNSSFIAQHPHYNGGESVCTARCGSTCSQESLPLCVLVCVIMNERSATRGS